MLSNSKCCQRKLMCIYNMICFISIGFRRYGMPDDLRTYSVVTGVFNSAYTFGYVYITIPTYHMTIALKFRIFTEIHEVDLVYTPSRNNPQILYVKTIIVVMLYAVNDIHQPNTGQTIIPHAMISLLSGIRIKQIMFHNR